MPLNLPVRPRDVHEQHRVSTPLELLVDLAFVVGVAQVAASQHHALAEGHVATALGAFPTAFFAIWWAWMNFTWFASAYDNDDVPYRVAALVQIAGVLVIAAGVPRAFDHHDFAVVTIGYGITRLALISQWLRVGGSAAQRTTARRYAAGLAIVQVGWFGALALPASAYFVAFFVLVAAELAVPRLAERDASTPWHPGHIAERYRLFTLIVLGESMLAPTLAVQAGVDNGGPIGDLIQISIGGLLTVFGLWWLYFDHDAEAMFDQAMGADDVSRPPAAAKLLPVLAASAPLRRSPLLRRLPTPGSGRGGWCSPGATGTTWSSGQQPPSAPAWPSRSST
ncbi:MAG: low temperature requirement protein A [Ilumatobacteraceae bacterium]